MRGGGLAALARSCWLWALVALLDGFAFTEAVARAACRGHGGSALRPAGALRGVRVMLLPITRTDHLGRDGVTSRRVRVGRMLCLGGSWGLAVLCGWLELFAGAVSCAVGALALLCLLATLTGLSPPVASPPPSPPPPPPRRAAAPLPFPTLPTRPAPTGAVPRAGMAGALVAARTVRAALGQMGVRYRAATPLPLPERAGTARTTYGAPSASGVAPGSRGACGDGPRSVATGVTGVAYATADTDTATRRRLAGLEVDGCSDAAGWGVSRLSGLLSRAYAPSTNKQDVGHWRAWERVCARLGTSPWRVDVAANTGADPVGYAEECYLMGIALVMLYSEMRPRSHSDPAADPRSAVAKLRAVRRCHRKRWPPIEMVPISAVSGLVKGMLREYIDEHGVAGLVPNRKLPLTNEIINAMLAVYDGAQRGDLVVDRSSYYWVAMFAVFAVLAESGERKDEVPRFTFNDLTWKVSGALHKVLTPALYARLRAGDGVYYAHGTSKNDPVGQYFAATPTFLPWRALSAGRCACRALAELEMEAKVPAGQRAATPLYGPSVGQRFSPSQLDAAFTLMLACGAGLSDDEISKYSVHSFRIFLACALLAANCPRWLIMRMLRWRSEKSLEIYARVSDAEWSGRLSDSLGVTVDASLVPRMPQIDMSKEQQEAFYHLAHSLLSTDISAAAPEEP